MKAYNWLIFQLVVFLSTFNNIIIPSPIGQLRIVYFLFPFMILGMLENLMNKRKIIINRIGLYVFIVIYVMYLGYGAITLSYSFYAIGTLNLIIQQFLSSLYFIYFVSFFIVYPNLIKRHSLFFLNLLRLLAIIAILQIGFAIVGFEPIKLFEKGQGFFQKGRPGWFFGDSNWLAYFSFFIYIIIFQLYRNKLYKKKKVYEALIYVIVILIITQSRITLLLLILHIILFVIKYKTKIFPTIATIFIGLSIYITISGSSMFFLKFLPERFSYDVVGSDVGNMRTIDAGNLIEQINIHHRQLSGFGWGSLEFIKNVYSPYREYKTTINFMPAQIYFDFGLVGCIFFTLLFLISFIKIKDNHSRFVLVAFVASSCFHMPIYFTFNWILLGLYVYVASNKTGSLSAKKSLYGKTKSDYLHI